MTQEEIEAFKQNVAVTTKATRPFVFDQPTPPGEETECKIILAATTVFGRIEYMTRLAPNEYWDLHFNECVNKLEKGKLYCIIQNADWTRKEMEHICLVVYKYLCFMSTLPDQTNYQLVESEMIRKRLDTPLYNITKGIPWLAQKWPEIPQYLMTANLYLMGEAPLEAPSSREVTLELQSSDTKQSREQKQEEEYEYTLSEEEHLEAARIEAEKQKYIFQQPPTEPPPALKKSLDKGKQPRFQGYTQRSGDGNQTPTKDKSQKQTQKENPSAHSHTKSRTEGSKKAGSTKRPSDDDPNHDPDSEGSHAGKHGDRSGADN